MDDNRYSVSAVSMDRTAGSDARFRTLVSTIERSRINTFIPQFALATTEPVTPWVRASNDVDIETEILEWIVSHVPRARRSKAH
jgi:hypothetical protein